LARRVLARHVQLVQCDLADLGLAGLDVGTPQHGRMITPPEADGGEDLVMFVVDGISLDFKRYA